MLLSLAFAGYSAYYKTKYWGFNFTPRKTTDVWTVEEHVSFVPNGENIRISMARPLSTAGFKILDEDIVAPKYKIEKKTDRIELTSKPRHKLQDIYYRVLLYDNVDSRGKTKAENRESRKSRLWTNRRPFWPASCWKCPGSSPVTGFSR